VARMGERRVAYRALMGRPEERCHLQDLGIERENNIKMDLQEI